MTETVITCSVAVIRPPADLELLIKLPCFMFALAGDAIFWQRIPDNQMEETQEAEETGCDDVAIFWGAELSHLNAGGRHLRRLVVDPEPVPAR